MTLPLYCYPPAALFGRPIAKSRFYEKTTLRELVTRQVEKIVWQYKLAPETINLPAKPFVPEIQIMSLALKPPELNRDVLRCIDHAVPFPLIFELGFDEKTQVIAAYKQASEPDASRWLVSDYFASDWLPSSAPRATLPVALDLAGLYERLLQSLIPLPARKQENLADLVARVEQVTAKQRELEKTASQLAKEKQFNRKVGINSRLRQRKTELEQLSSNQ